MKKCAIVFFSLIFAVYSADFSKIIESGKNLDVTDKSSLIKWLAPEKDMKSFNQSAELYIVEFLKDNQAPGFGAAGTFRTVNLKVIKAFRGSLKEGGKFNLKRRNKNNLRFGPNQVNDDYPPGIYIIEVNEHVRDLSIITNIVKADEKTVKAAILAGKLPLNWSVEEGKLKNPWGDERKPHFLGKNLLLTITPVAPVKEIKWTNPDGDGIFKVIITNVSQEAQEVHALKCKGSEILWADSVLNGSQGKFQKPVVIKSDKSPTAGKVILQPGKSVSCEINALKMKGIEWPRGGYRLNLEFCIGEQIKAHSFYYMSRHHDGFRKK